MGLSSYRWVIVGVGALMTCVGIGAMFSLAVYLEPMSTETGWSRAGISGAMTIDFLTMGIAGFAWGTASDRFGTRPVVLSGALLLGLFALLGYRGWQRQSADEAALFLRDTLWAETRREQRRIQRWLAWRRK